MFLKLDIILASIYFFSVSVHHLRFLFINVLLFDKAKHCLTLISPQYDMSADITNTIRSYEAV